MKQLERENRELRRTNEILKAAAVNSTGQCNTSITGSEGWHGQDREDRGCRRSGARKSGSAGGAATRSARSHERWVLRRGRSSRSSCPTGESTGRRNEDDPVRWRWPSARRSRGDWPAASPAGRSRVASGGPPRRSAARWHVTGGAGSTVPSTPTIAPFVALGGRSHACSPGARYSGSSSPRSSRTTGRPSRSPAGWRSATGPDLRCR